MLDDSFDTSRRLARLPAASLVSGPARRPPCVPMHAGWHNFGLRDAPRRLESWILPLLETTRKATCSDPSAGWQLGRRPNPAASAWRARGQHHEVLPGRRSWVCTLCPCVADASPRTYSAWVRWIVGTHEHPTLRTHDRRRWIVGALDRSPSTLRRCMRRLR